MSICYEKEENPFVFACTQGFNIGPLTVNTPPTTPIVLASISIDISDGCHSSILVSFSGEFNVSALLFPINPVFRVLRTCNNQTTQVSSNLSSPSGIPFNNLMHFAYQICDCDANICCDCHCVNYTVEFIPGPIIGPDTISINNVTLSARTINDCC